MKSKPLHETNHWIDEHVYDYDGNKRFDTWKDFWNPKDINRGVAMLEFSA